MILLILASGRGTRLKYKTKNKPKCLININGKPILKFRIEKFLPDEKKSKKTLDAEKEKDE